MGFVLGKGSCANGACGAAPLHKCGRPADLQEITRYPPKRLGYGLQFCPHCLAEDIEPYFRLAWRLAFYTHCPKHYCMLLDLCPQWGQGAAAYTLGPIHWCVFAKLVAAH